MPKVRSKVKRQLAPILHIYCEGEKTEPYYLRGYLDKHHPGNRLVKIERTDKNTPVQLVDEAIRRKEGSDTPEQDLFWVVYDRESTAKYSNALHKESCDNADSNSIEVALSNVCFEMWLLLHFINSSAPYTSYEDLIRRSQLRVELHKIGITEYEKADPSIFEHVSFGLRDARERARRINTNMISTSPAGRDKPYLLNPYTDIYKLLDAIDNGGCQAS